MVIERAADRIRKRQAWCELAYDVLATYADMALACGDTYYQRLFEHAALEAQVETAGQRLDEVRPRPNDRPAGFALSPEAAAVAKVHSIDFGELVEKAGERWSTVIAVKQGDLTKGQAARARAWAKTASAQDIEASRLILDRELAAVSAP